jgi:heterodisulfide reductase subunit B
LNEDRAYTFFPGCMARIKLPHIERSVRTVMSDLGVSLVDQKRFSCCPDPVVFRSASMAEWLSLGARNLALSGGRPLLTLCPGCSASLSETAGMLEEHPERVEPVRPALEAEGLSLEIPGVFHFLAVLDEPEIREAISRRIEKPFKNLRVACHYGCHLVRPSDAVRFDDPERPESLDRMVELTGARSIDYEDKYMCCGRPSLDQPTSEAMAGHKLDSMLEAGCDLLVVACPFCYEQFDLGQLVIGRKRGNAFDLPVLYVTELIALAMGHEPGELGVGLHRVEVKGVR